MTNRPATFPSATFGFAILSSDLSHVAVRVAVRIGLHLHVESGQCNPGVGTIATGSKVSERSVYRQLARPEQAGWIRIESGGGRERSNHYALKYPDKAASGFNPPINPDTRDNKPCHQGGRQKA